MTEFYTADEVFGTGTMGELTPIVKIDGRDTSQSSYPVLQVLRQAFINAKSTLCDPI